MPAHHCNGARVYNLLSAETGSTSTEVRGMATYEKTVRQYFESWNKHDAAAVVALYNEGGYMRTGDPKPELSMIAGREKLTKVFEAMFKFDPAASVEVLAVYTTNFTNVVVAELVVNLNGEANKVVRGSGPRSEGVCFYKLI